MAVWMVRALVIAGSAWGGAATASAFAWPPEAGMLAGALLGAGAVGLEIAAARATGAGLAWAAMGGLAGLLGGVAAGGALAAAWPPAGAALRVVGRKHLGHTLEVTVTSVLQTSAGRMIFTRPRTESPVPGPRDG